MNIKILDSWLREFLKTKASHAEIAEKLSLASVSIERIEKIDGDFVYDIEITTNRPDLMSVIGIAKEAYAILPQFGIEAKLIEPKNKTVPNSIDDLKLNITNDEKLVNRICAVIMEVKMGDSPDFIKNRLEASGVRSLNNLVDITNYIMRETGHPAHVFDYDRLKTKNLIIRESKKGEKIKTLDEKIHTLSGGDIVADNGDGEIEDLLGVMGTENSVVKNNTKRIVLFLDNNEPNRIRKTSMELGIRSEAAIINEKGIDPELTHKALLRGIELYCQTADAKILSKVIDIYPNKVKLRKMTISNDKISKVIGIDIPIKTSASILSSLGFETTTKGDVISVNVPTNRLQDVSIEEDLIEEVARVYGYDKLPNLLPQNAGFTPLNISDNPFFWEKRAKDALKYWGFTETYTYSMVSSDLFEGPLDNAVTIQNPLSEDRIYMRKTLIPSLLEVIHDNPSHDRVKIFEIANVYHKRKNDLPCEKVMLAGVIKSQNVSFFTMKGTIEQLLFDLGIKNFIFKKRGSGGVGADVFLDQDLLGEIEVLDNEIVDFEFDFEIIRKHANLKKVYKEISKFPPIIEDIRIIISAELPYEKIVKTIKQQSDLVNDVFLLDVYKDKKTFRITYQDFEKNLTNEEITPIREKIISVLQKDLKAELA